MPCPEFRRILSPLSCVALIATLCATPCAYAIEEKNDAAAPAESGAPSVAEAEETGESDRESAQKALCTLIEASAAENDLPIGVFDQRRPDNIARVADGEAVGTLIAAPSAGGAKG